MIDCDCIEVFDSHLQRNLSCVLGQVGDMESKRAMFKTSVVDAAGWNKLGNTSSEGGRQAFQGAAFVGKRIPWYCHRGSNQLSNLRSRWSDANHVLVLDEPALYSCKITGGVMRPSQDHT